MVDNGVVAGGRLTDWVSLGVLAAFVARDAIDDAVAAVGKQARRSDGELLSRPVDQDLLSCFFPDLLAGSLDQFSADERRSGADQGDELRRVHAAPAVLC